jgi:hypothetical protein
VPQQVPQQQVQVLVWASEVPLSPLVPILVLVLVLVLVRVRVRVRVLEQHYHHLL